MSKEYDKTSFQHFKSKVKHRLQRKNQKRSFLSSQTRQSNDSSNIIVTCNKRGKEMAIQVTGRNQYNKKKKKKSIIELHFKNNVKQMNAKKFWSLSIV